MPKKIILHILLLMCFSSANAQYTEQDSSRIRSIIFRIFSLDRIDPNDYEKGYIFDRIFKRREFHRPVNFIPLELRYGFAYNSGGGVLGLGALNDKWMTYETEGLTSFNGGNFSSRIGHQVDLDLVKTNLAYYLFGNSWLDMHSGINLRYNSLLMPSKVPDEWNSSKESWKKNSKFNARLIELSWSQSLILQWFESWYSTYRYTYGMAISELYENESSATGYGPSQSFTMGARYIIDSELKNRFSVGLDLKLTSTTVNRIQDPKDITPIKSFSIQTAGVYATASVFFGGQQTKGDIGKSYYYAKDYISAKRYLNEFIDENPNHANFQSALRLVAESDRKIPYQLMRQGMSFDERGLVVRAVEKYIRAKSLADTLLADVIDDRLREISYREIERAEKWLYAGDSDTAIAHVTMVSGWYPQTKHHINRFKIYNFMSKGEQLYKIGLYDRALDYFQSAEKLDPALAFEIGTHKHRIASDLLTMADSLKDINSLQFVVYALEESQKLTQSLSPANLKILDQLKQKLKAKEEYEIRQRIDKKLTIDKLKKSENPPIMLGMSTSQVESIMGPPKDVISSGSQKQNQLWIYEFSNREKISLTFINYSLYKIGDD